jgi:hypothetical protein
VLVATRAIAGNSTLLLPQTAEVSNVNGWSIDSVSLLSIAHLGLEVVRAPDPLLLFALRLPTRKLLIPLIDPPICSLLFDNLSAAVRRFRDILSDFITGVTGKVGPVNAKYGCRRFAFW